MNRLTENLRFLSEQKGDTFNAFLARFGVTSVGALTVDQLQLIAQEFNVPMDQLLNYCCFVNKEQLKNIKLLILDIDGVMTDAGMYFMESGDQMKKYNAKDGMAIMALTKQKFHVGIISSGFKLEMVKARADLLNIQHVYVGREPKMDILNQWCAELELTLAEVAIIGDDINDLPVMRSVGFSACPSDAVPEVKKQVDLVLTKKGGQGCVREFIDHYLLDAPVTR